VPVAKESEPIEQIKGGERGATGSRTLLEIPSIKLPAAWAD